MKSSTVQFRDIISQKEYFKILMANTISRFGDSLDSVAFVWLVYAITGSASWTAIITAINFIPTVVIQPFAGTLVEGMNKKRVMVVTDFIRGIVVAALAILYVQNCVTPWILVVFTLIISTSEAFTMPASTAILPKLLGKDFYEYGVALNGTVTTVVQLIGLACAGIIIGLFGVQTAIFIDGITFFLSGIIRGLVKLEEEKKRKIQLNLKAFFSDFKEGIQYIIVRPIIRNFILLAVILNAILVPMNAFEAPFVKEVLKQGSELLSIIGIGFVIGAGIGSATFPALSKRFSIRTRFTISGILIGVSYIGLLTGGKVTEYKYLVYGSTLLMVVLMGCAVAHLNASISVLVMKLVEENYLSRVSAIMNAGSVAAMPVTSFVCSLLALVVPVGWFFFICGVLTIILFIIIAVKKVRFEEVQDE
ncbi:MAG: MFS transporter [Lachnospiraceae bacterium]